MEASTLTNTQHTLTITNPQAAQALLDPVSTRFLKPFMACESTMKDAANTLGVRMNVMFYWINRLCVLGLLRVVRTEKRSGRAIRYYRWSADAFFVPFAGTGATTPEEMRTKIELNAHKRLTRALVAASPSVGVLIHCGPCERLTFDFNHTPNPASNRKNDPVAPAVVDEWYPLELDFQSAKRFQSELHDLLERYQNVRGGQQYLVRLALAPVNP